MVKKFLVPIFEKLLDVIFILSALGVLIYAISLAIGFKSVLLFFVTLIGGLIFLILSFGIIYILLDIRTEVKKFNQNLPQPSEEQA